MCGLAGYINYSGKAKGDALERDITHMLGAIAHRGPDDYGHWLDETKGIVLGHRRLSVIDTSEHGHQPMMSASGRYVLVYNGELYNYPELKQKLVYPWQGESDTEVWLAAIECWGLEAALDKSEGMFALALWDRHTQKLYLARDRAGEKPLYYGKQGDHVYFASELKSLCAVDHFTKRIDPQALNAFLHLGFVPEPQCIYQDTYKLRAGYYLCIDGPSGDIIDQKQYWSAHSHSTQTIAPTAVSYDESKAELEQRLAAAVQAQMVADVPLGALLSGGIDSSLVVALMQQHSNTPIHSFSIGFHEDGFNEAHYAKAVATHLGTHHTELYIDAKDALAAVPAMPKIYDEPFADVSQIPTFLVSKLAREHVTVALTGDGADELFGGYHRYVQIARFAGLNQSSLGRAMAVLSAKAIQSLSIAQWNRLLKPLQSWFKTRYQVAPLGQRMHKLAAWLSHQTAEQLYQYAISHWHHHPCLARHAAPFSLDLETTAFSAQRAAMRYDQHLYLPSDILTKTDRASMANSLELRSPFLSKHIIDYAGQLPDDYLFGAKSGKGLLKDIAYQYVPAALLDRPKMGFGVPIDRWLRHELRDWGEDLLSEASLQKHDLLTAAPIRNAWKEHLSAKQNRQYELWNILMFQSWYNEYMET